MNTILRKIAEFFGIKSPERSGMDMMTEMEQQEDQSNDMAAIPGEMGMSAQMQPKERKM
jgi:hypothetical protein